MEKAQPNPNSEIALFVKAVRAALGKTQDDFAYMYNCTKGNVSAWENGRHEPTYATLADMSSRSGVALPQSAKPDFSNEPVTVRLVPAQKQAQNVTPAPVGSRQIPLISCVQAGMWTEVADSYAPGDAAEWLLTDLDLSGYAFALEIKGESMLPDFRPGDRVIIDPEIAPSPGDFVVAKNGSNEATFKKYRPRGVNEHGDQVFELVPLNPDYETMRSDYTPIIIIGTMVEHRRYRKK